MNTAPPRTAVITLQNDAGAPWATCTLAGARTTRITTVDGGDAGAGVAVQSVEVAYETMSMSTT